jgi:spermidine synthase
MPPAGRIVGADARQLLVLAVFTASGVLSLGLEVAWFRVLTLFLRPTVYGYAMMLAAVLAGIAIGSYAAAPFLRRHTTRDLFTTLAWLEGGIATASLLSIAVLPAIPAVMATAGPPVEALIGGYLAYQALVSIVVILPTMVLFGAAFPIGLQVWAVRGPDAGDVASRVGLFYALNVGGAIAGSLGAGFLLLPWLGSLQTVRLLAAGALASALALLAAARSPAPVRFASALVLAACCIAGWRLAPDPFDAFLAQRYAGAKIVWQREAVQATGSVHHERRGTYTLHVSGNHQASSVGATHHRIGSLPMVVHPDPRQALVIGLGGGATAGAVAQHPGVSVDVVELSREVAQAADRFFRDVNYGVLRKPHVRLHVDDGRNYLLLTGKRYDVVTADVILPIHAGSGNLYSREYFTLVRQALKPGGLVLQWVAGTEAEYKLIMRTFLSVFPETTLWADGSLMLGAGEPLQLRRADVEAKLEDPQRREMMASLGVRSFDDLLALYLAGPVELRNYVGEGPILTDDRPMVEYFLSLPRDRRVDLSRIRGDVTRHIESGDSMAVQFFFAGTTQP